MPLRISGENFSTVSIRIAVIQAYSARLSTRWKPPVQRMKRCERSCITNASDFTVGNGSKQLRTSLFVLGDQDLITKWYNYTKSRRILLQASVYLSVQTKGETRSCAGCQVPVSSYFSQHTPIFPII